MAKVSMKEREKKRIRIVKKHAKRRADLKENIRKSYLTEDGAWDLMDKLQSMPRSASATRVQRRCRTCGRPHGVYRKFGLCRLCLRKFVMQGLVPGLVKASW
jgi:small subunit ribosomal protein S14